MSKWLTEKHHRGHVTGGDATRLDRAFERVGGRACGKHRQRRIGVAAIDRLIEVGLLGFGREARRRPAALGIDDHQRKLGHDREAHRLRLQRNARTRGGGDAQLAGVARADRRADRGNLILRLEGGDAIFLEARQVVKQRGCRRDRIAAEEHLQVRKLAARNEAKRQRLGTGHRAV